MHCALTGSPWENGYNERFNGTLRKEVLNTEWFHTKRQAQVAINVWLRKYTRSDLVTH
jgi:transposase InsO family protein